MKLTNKNILITGVGKGLGRIMMNEFTKAGAFVYGVTRSKSDFKNFKNNNRVKLFFGDVRNINLIKKILYQSIKDKRLINGLVNNAGIRQRLQFEKISKEKIKEVFDVNFFSIFEILKQYIKYCKDKKIHSSIVNIGSIVGETGFTELSGYSSTKGALKSLTQCLAIEFASKNIRVNLVNPGFIKTSYYERFKSKKKLYNWTLSKIPLKRWGNSIEIANVVGFLISNESSYITGEAINADGGWLKS